MAGRRYPDRPGWRWLEDQVADAGYGTIREFAAAAGIKFSTANNALRWRYAPRAASLIGIAKALGMKPSEVRKHMPDELPLYTRMQVETLVDAA